MPVPVAGDKSATYWAPGAPVSMTSPDALSRTADFFPQIRSRGSHPHGLKSHAEAEQKSDFKPVCFLRDRLYAVARQLPEKTAFQSG